MKPHLSVLLVLFVAACASSEPERVVVNGEEGIRIKPVSMLGDVEPTAENIAEQAIRIRTGSHGGSLNKVASRHCESGFRILHEGEPEANIYVVTPFVQYRVSQEFVISCT